MGPREGGLPPPPPPSGAELLKRALGRGADLLDTKILTTGSSASITQSLHYHVSRRSSTSPSSALHHSTEAFGSIAGRACPIPFVMSQIMMLSSRLAETKDLALSWATAHT